MTPERIVVAMSGGVDSSVAAALLSERGFDVVGVSLKLWEHDASGGEASMHGCCTPADLRDARRVADHVGFPHYVFNLVEEFEQSVIDEFVAEYLDGRTPNPCVSCNDSVKFETLLARARALGAGALATGHYARLRHEADGRASLLRALDSSKDQTYFLYNLPSETLSFLRFPVGELDKASVRAEARRLRLPVADKPDSQDICFVPGNDHASFVASRAADADALRPGRFIGPTGDVLGLHDGVHRYTVGQRRGLGISSGVRLFINRIDAEAGDIHVGLEEALYVPGLLTERCNWISGVAPPPGTEVDVRVRHQHRGALGTLHPHSDGGCHVRFREAVRSVAPGQAAVFTVGDEVIGGGRIRAAVH